MKILFIVENFYPKIGGVETLFFELTKALAKEGHEVVVYTSGLKSNNLRREVIESIQVFRSRSSNRYLFTFFTLASCIKFARQADIIHTTSYNAALPAFLSAKFLSKPVVITFHEAWGKLWFSLKEMSIISKWLHYGFEKMILRFKFNAFIAVSEYTELALKENKVDENLIVRIYNGIDYSKLEQQIKHSNSTPSRYLFYGRAGISKGIPLLIDCFKLIQEQGIDNVKIDLVLSGEDEAVNNIRQLVNKLSLSSHIGLQKPMDYNALLEAIQNSKAVIIPSFTEGFCFVAAESIALNTPVISSGKGALKEVVSGKYITMEEYSAEGLFKAFSKAENDEWQISEKRKFRLEDTISAYKKVYQQMLAE